jgi:hypothetical protein
LIPEYVDDVQKLIEQLLNGYGATNGPIKNLLTGDQ